MASPMHLPTQHERELMQVNDYLNKQLDELRARIAALEAEKDDAINRQLRMQNHAISAPSEAAAMPSGWISATERLPENSQEVRFQVGSGAVLNGWFATAFRSIRIPGGDTVYLGKRFVRGDFCSAIEIGTYTPGAVKVWQPLAAAPAEGRRKP